MKEQANKNMRMKVFFTILGISSSFLLIINFIPIFIAHPALTTEFTGDLDRDRSSYVNQSNPDMNYDDSYECIISNSCETIAHFNLELLPKKTEKLYFFMWWYNFGDVYEAPVDDVEINIIFIGSNWTESEITWNNKPHHEYIIETVNASEILQSPFIERYNLNRAVDLTEIFKENDLDEISFCINITENNDNLNTSVYLEGLHLLWNYEKDLLSYTTIISTFIIFSMLIGTIYYLRKEVYSCTNCGTKRRSADKFCLSCGTKFNETIINKESDYQLVLILLWIFTFLEVAFLLITLIINLVYMFSPFLIVLFLVPWVILCYKQVKKKIRKFNELRIYRK